jgi:hypothetical protein
MSSSAIPQEYKNAYTFSIMRDPVKATCGHIFEKSFIQDWLRTNKTCPFDRAAIGDQLVKQEELKNKIDNYLREHPEILAELKQEEAEWTARRNSLAGKAFQVSFPVMIGTACYLFGATKACSVRLVPWQLVPMFSIGALPWIWLRQYPNAAIMISSLAGATTAYYLTGSPCFAATFAGTMVFTGKFITHLCDSVDAGRPLGSALEELDKVLQDG